MSWAEDEGMDAYSFADVPDYYKKDNKNMENNKQEMIFADGMNFKQRHEKAPETVRGSVYFKASKFIEFLKKHEDEKGFVNTKMMKSKKDGSIYFILDTWKPAKKELVDEETGEKIPDLTPPRTLTDEQKSKMTVDEVADLSDVPF